VQVRNFAALECQLHRSIPTRSSNGCASTELVFTATKTGRCGLVEIAGESA
jgi:hypothetical protein